MFLGKRTTETSRLLRKWRSGKTALVRLWVKQGSSLCFSEPPWGWRMGRSDWTPNLSISQVQLVLAWTSKEKWYKAKFRVSRMASPKYIWISELLITYLSRDTEDPVLISFGMGQTAQVPWNPLLRSLSNYNSRKPLAMIKDSRVKPTVAVINGIMIFPTILTPP